MTNTLTIEEKALCSNHSTSRLLSREHLYCVVIYLLFAIGAVTNVVAFNIVALLALFLCVGFLDFRKSFFILVVFTPNNMLVCLSSNSSFRLIGVFYLLILLRLFFNKKIRIPVGLYLCILLSLFICLVHVPVAGIHDFALCVQIFVGIIVWVMFLQNANNEKRYEVYKAFVFGMILMFFGMFINKIVNNEIRFYALWDDPNFTSIAFAALFSMSLFFIVNSIKRFSNIIISLFALVGGLLTASRGFLLSIGVVIALYILLGLRYRRTRFVFWIGILFIALFFMLLSFRVPFIVTIYDETIGRTLELNNTYFEGKFLDITSGRMFLWKYYLGKMFNEKSNILFGYGFNYYLVENGGYGLVAHNSFVSGIMGIGFVGTTAVLLAYSYIFSLNKGKGRKSLLIKTTAFCIIIAVLVGYFFLDGLLDIRLSLYFSLFTIAYSFVRDKKPIILEEK